MTVITYPVNVLGELKEEGDYGLHKVNTVQLFALGAKYIMGDRIYRYGKSAGACYAGRGVAFWNAMADGIDWTLLKGSQKIGDRQVTFAAAAHPVFAKNELYGGSILISDSDLPNHGAGQALVDSEPMNRIIAGNEASTLNGECTVYLVTPLSRATTATSYAFLMPNPYSKLKTDLASGRVMHGMAGIPAAYVDAADKYFWTQTWGPLWVAMNDDLSDKSYEEQEAYFRWDGSVCLNTNAAPGTHVNAQRAGFVMDRGNSATFIMLQVCP